MTVVPGGEANQVGTCQRGWQIAEVRVSDFSACLSDVARLSTLLYFGHAIHVGRTRWQICEKKARFIGHAEGPCGGKAMPIFKNLRVFSQK